MPPKIKFYADRGLTKPHTGDLEILDAGASKETSIFVKNEGDGALLDMNVKLEVDSQIPLNAQIENEHPKDLKPEEIWEAKIKWSLNPNEKHGLRKASLKVSGRYVR